MKTKRHLTSLLFVLVIVSADLFTKWIVKNTLTYGKPVRVIGNFFRLTFIENRGISFGLFSNVSSPYLTPILLGISFVVVALLVYTYIKDGDNLLVRISTVLILGGAIGNIVDRFVDGKVVDFLDFGIGVKRWPYFNLADSVIVIGSFILGYYIIFVDGRNKGKSEEKPVEGLEEQGSG